MTIEKSHFSRATSLLGNAFGPEDDLNPRVVVDEKGKPIPGVTIAANAYRPGGAANVERTESRSDGSFELFNYPQTPNSFPGGAAALYKAR